MSRALAVVVVLVALCTAASDRAAQAPAGPAASLAPTLDLTTLSCADRFACFEILHRYRMGTAGREEARAAVDSERTLCAHGHGAACVDLALWSAGGFEDFVPQDLEAARVFARRSCDLGFYCSMVEDLSYPPPTPAELDDIREAVLRAGIPGDRPRNVTTQSHIWCLAFGTDADPEGQDPPEAFMARFADIEDVRPRSWCVENRTGNRYSVGPIDARPQPFSNGRTVRAWIVHEYFNGSGGSGMIRLSQKGGSWVAAQPEFSREKGIPPFPQVDLEEDRRRIATVASAFADAWNRQDFDHMVRLHSLEEPAASVTADHWRTALTDRAANTHLEPDAEAIEFGQLGSMSASAQLRLRGTWTPRPGAIVPLDPWKHKGSVLRVRLHFRKETSWWEPGDWRLSFFSPPWAELRVAH